MKKPPQAAERRNDHGGADTKNALPSADDT